MDEIKVTVVTVGSRPNLALRYLDPETGSIKHKTAGTPNHREAQKAAAKLEAELRKGRSWETEEQPNGNSWPLATTRLGVLENIPSRAWRRRDFQPTKTPAPGTALPGAGHVTWRSVRR